MPSDPFKIRSFTPELLGEGWDWTFANITGLEGVSASFRAQWIGALYDGLDHRKLDRAFVAAVCAADWSWPWFAHWYETFRSLGTWPSQWGPIRKALSAPDWTPEEIAEEVEEHAARLILQTAAARAAHLRDARKRLDPDIRWYWRWELRSGLEPNAVFEVACAEFGPAVEQLYPSPETPLPPYFPGDTTDIRSIRRTR